jgi:RNA polymerase sigma factor (sigma-70 family)
LTDRGRRATVRHQREHECLEDHHHPVEDRSPERVILDQEALDRVIAAIQRLPERTREVFLLHRFEEMTCSAIAKQMGLSISAIEKHIMRALVALHDELNGL